MDAEAPDPVARRKLLPGAVAGRGKAGVEVSAVAVGPDLATSPAILGSERVDPREREALLGDGGRRLKGRVPLGGEAGSFLGCDEMDQESTQKKE